ncbi:MAG: protein kinase, partial [Deltaproteobacteria bacterium]|nr:protein kinase [Deltaproteobacteria bacterium]
MDVGHAAPVFGAGRFEVRGTLGAGGAGVVYRAFDRQLQREVALKLLRQASGRDLYRFKREFRALADIVHPNLVTLHELHAAAGDWYFTMELIEGVSF